MKSLLVCLTGLMIFVQAGAAQQSIVLGQVRLSGGLPVAGAQVMLFDLADLRRGVVAYATTDEAGQFALPLEALGGAFALPEGFVLGANYPNPFNPSTIIPYELAETSQVRLEVFNTLGQHMATLVNGEQGAGTYSAQWDGTDAAGQAVAAGMYLYRLTVDGVEQTGRMMLVDGQAGIPMRGANVAALPMAEGPSSVYGLVVSGPGMAAYVDADFGVEAGMESVDIQVEAWQNVRMKVTSNRILGDVNNNGQVDIDDGLLVAAYHANSSTSMPNNGDISLGDVNCNGQVDLTDARLITTYIVNPSDPAVQSLSIGQAGGCGVLVDDHGDTLSEATQITTANVSGYLSPGDTDYFQVPMSSPAHLRVYLDSTGEEIAISIYDGSGTSPGGEGHFTPNEIILLDASPDTYYIQVQGVSNSTEGNYTLRVTFSEYIEQEGLLEDLSDSIEKAIHTITDSTTSHYISPPDDEDWFWVRVSGSGTLTAYTTSGIDTYGSLYDSSGDELASDDNTGADRNFQVSAEVSPGTYYIQVQGAGGEVRTGIGAYTLHVNSMTDDHSDSRSDATRITIGSTAVGYISGTSDNDYFRVRVSGSGRLTAYTTSDVDNYGSLYNSSGTELASDDIIRDNPSDRRFRNFQVSAEVNPGTYYIRVRGHGSGRYLLRVMYEPDEEGFNIELVFTDSVTIYERELVRRAAARWMSIITGDLPACDFSENPRTLRLRDQLERLRAFFGADIRVPDLSFELNDVVDDLRLYVHTLHIPSEDNRTTRGYAKQYLQRPNKSTSLPVAGFIVLNKAEIYESNAETLAGLEMPDKDGMYHTTVHEIGHALGFAWQILDDNGLLSGGDRDFWLADKINIDVNFTGQRAITAFNNAGGLNYTGDKVPIENNADYGTQRSHWRYLVFDPRPYIQEYQPQFIRPSELMVGLSHLNRSLSAITIAALADLGYQVDISQADPYRLPSNRNLGIAKPVADHSSDHGRENMNCILPGPIHVVDENGRTIRIIGE